MSFWLNSPDARLGRVVVVDDSGVPLDSLLEVLRLHPNRRYKTVELLSVRQPAPAVTSPDAAELEMIDRALAASALLRETPYFIKATADLAFPRISRLLNRLKDDFDFAVDTRTRFGLTSLPTYYIDTDLLLFRTAFYRDHLTGLRDKLEASHGSLGQLLYQQLSPRSRTRGAILRWPVNTDPELHARAWHARSAPPAQQLLRKARAATRTFTPSLWL